jgi:Fic family protein
MIRPRPWYENTEEEIEKAGRYVLAHLRNSPPGPISSYDHEVDNFLKFSLIRLIFESNRIEKAGLSEGDTRKLLKEYNFGDAKLTISKKGPEDEVSFGKTSRSAREVEQHARAIGLSLDEEMRHLEKNSPLFKEKVIKRIHGVLAENLIGKEWGALKSGEYRDGPCHTGLELIYPAHENIPVAMKKWMRDSNKLMQSEENLIINAARISYNFVAIHPFPDFNGRLSRIIMNMVLRVKEFPFLAVLRGNAKGKHRYLTALKHANRGKIESYACLIAMAVNEGFEQFNKNLELAGLEPIRPEE